MDTRPASPRWTADEIGAAAQLACLLEASAAKPGNVSPGRPFADMRFRDFIVSAVAIGPAMRAASAQSLGHTILRAVKDTRQATAANTNLGIVLLLAPLARAAAVATRADGLRAAVARTLAETTVDDARLVYEAIRLAAPGGLGTAADQDVASEPSESLLEVMRLAAGRDDVAREYATAFETTFDAGVPTLARLEREGIRGDPATVELFLTLLSRRPDTLIARKAGRAAAESVSRGARRVLERGGARTPEGRAALAAFDAELRDPANRFNPGTTADLSAAVLFVHLLRGGKWTATCSVAAISASRFRKTTWCLRRRTSSRSPATGARDCTATTTGRA
jgi:triphosphoribosyl-dephospho-CoA synthase